MEGIDAAIRLTHGFVALMVEQIGDIVGLLQLRCAAAQHHGKHFILIIRHGSQLFLDVLDTGKKRIRFPNFIEEFIADIFVQEHLRDDFILTGRTTQTKVGAYGFQIINHPFRADGNILVLH